VSDTVLFGAHIDLDKNELRNARVENFATTLPTPAVGDVGLVAYDVDDGVFRVWTGTTWRLDASHVGGATAAALRDRSTHTGTQLAATVSDFNAAVRLNRLDQLAAPTAPVALGGQKITGLAPGTNPTDAATVSQLGSGGGGGTASGTVPHGSQAATLVHGLGVQGVSITVFETASPHAIHTVGIEYTSTSAATIYFTVAPLEDEFSWNART